MEPSLNLLGQVLPLALLVGLTLVAVGALVVGLRAGAGVAPDAAGTPGWQLALFAALVAFLLISVSGYVLAFVL